jgi:acyl-coenzyme A synthetase/AMP-(fatty) acid ligase
MDVGPDDANLAIIPLGHSYALGNIVVPLLQQGTRCVIAGSPLPQALAADCERWRPTVFPAVPALLRALARSEIPRERLGSLRLVISAGAALPADVAQQFRAGFGLTVHGFYGASETGGICYDRSGEATVAGRSVGTPLDGVSLEFARGDRFRVRSAAVNGKGVHRMPDLGRLTPAGELELLGRAGRTLKIAGRRLDLNEVENAARSLAGVRDAYAAAGQRADTVAIAVCSPRPAAELKPELRLKLAPWKVPDHWVVLSEFPLTARGKTDTRRLRAMLAAG